MSTWIKGKLPFKKISRNPTYEQEEYDEDFDFDEVISRRRRVHNTRDTNLESIKMKILLFIGKNDLLYVHNMEEWLPYSEKMKVQLAVVEFIECASI